MPSKKTTSKEAAKTDAIELLKTDHENVRELLSQLEESTTRAEKKRKELLTKIAMEFRVHARIEEEIFYPAFEQAGKNGEDEKLFLEAAEEHELVHTNLPMLEETDPSTELFSARAKVLKDLIEHHAEEEEKEMFPRARKLMKPAELRDLGEQMAVRKKELMRREELGQVEARNKVDSRSAAAG